MTTSAPRVRVLPEHVANQIAAGEVVERPASVVKELVENALDADARRVSILVEDGGKRLIKITDDGSGMGREDALLALRRHATSKIQSADDLASIRSLGFRGEALPSIRSVSRFTLRTRRREDDEGTRIVADGPHEPVVEPCGAPPGTEIRVEDLFAAVPARRKFLRRAGTEMARINAFVEQIALGRPDVHFTLVHNGRKSADYPADRDYEARILAVLGRDTCRALYPVELTIGEYRIRGFASEPGHHRNSNKHVFTYVNGRFVRDRVLQHGVTRAYADVLERGKHPVAVLWIDVPAGAVDVNVHPGKAEVRFSESGSVHSLVERSIRLMLSDVPWATGSLERTQLRATALPLFGSPGPDSAAKAPVHPVPMDPLPTDAPAPAGPPEPAPSAPTAPAPSPQADPTLEPLGYVGDRLVCRRAEALVVIDVARTRVARAKTTLEQAWADGEVLSRRLLFPARITLTTEQAAAASRSHANLSALGLDLEAFGGADWVVSAVPTAAAATPPEAVITTLLDGAPSNAPLAPETLIPRIAGLAADAPATDSTQSLLTDYAALSEEDRARVSVTHSKAEISAWFPR